MQGWEDHNSRAELMFRAIEKSVDFMGKTVIDLGCGFGDMLPRVWKAGADEVIGVDQNKETLMVIADKLIKAGFRRGQSNIILLNEFLEEYELPPADIAMCFSVLPYLTEPGLFVEKLALYPLCLIECQYWGDGPGPAYIKNDLDMADFLLENGFAKATNIGGTKVRPRNTYRTIWRCQ